MVGEAEKRAVPRCTEASPAEFICQWSSTTLLVALLCSVNALAADRPAELATAVSDVRRPLPTAEAEGSDAFRGNAIVSSAPGNGARGITELQAPQPALSVGGEPKSPPAAGLLTTPFSFTAPQFEPANSHPLREFGRPRGDKPASEPLASGDSAPELRMRNAWQQMADYRARGSVRVLTLWQNQGSTVSLQAGKHGSPSLQWSSRTMNRGGSTRGVLDNLMSVSIGGFGSSRNLPRVGNPLAAQSKQYITTAISPIKGQ